MIFTACTLSLMTTLTAPCFEVKAARTVGPWCMMFACRLEGFPADQQKFGACVCVCVSVQVSIHVRLNPLMTEAYSSSAWHRHFVTHGRWCSVYPLSDTHTYTLRWQNLIALLPDASVESYI